ncbi:MAG: two-component sensor histidine kinase [Rhodospirillales bacterium]|nr:two-component sensor histidine kinase [Rhodospirillales bacterium]
MFDVTRPNLRRETPRDYALGAVFLAAAFVVRYAADDMLSGVPFVTFILAVLFTAYFAGWRSSIGVAAASFLSAWYFFLEPRGSWVLQWPHGALALGFFTIISASQIGLVAMLVESLRRRDAKRMELESHRRIQQALFQELQHRVANGMQLISSILLLQGRLLAPASEAKEAIDAAAVRLATLARVHRRLNDPSLGAEGIGTALKELAEDVLAAAGRRDVEVTVAAPALAIKPAAGTSLAMVVAEATTNALKHAFAGRQGGTLDVRLQALPGAWQLTVTDNGPGYGGAVPGKTDSLGLLIIRSMASRLGGKVEFLNAPSGGAQLSLRFPDPTGDMDALPSQPVEQPARRSTDRQRAREPQPSTEQA